MEKVLNGQRTLVREIDVLPPDEQEELFLNIHQLTEASVEGCVVWDAAIVLLKFLFTPKGQQLVKNCNVIELGSGTGVVGLASLLAGASSAYITDMQELIPLMKLNLEENFELIKGCRKDLALNDAEEKSFKKVKVAELKWGDEKSFKECVDFVSQEGSDEKEKVCLLIADCVYYEQGADDLVKTITDIMSTFDSGSVALCSYAIRTTGDKVQVLKNFIKKLKNNNLSLSFVSNNDMDPVYQSDDISILKITKLQ